MCKAFLVNFYYYAHLVNRLQRFHQVIPKSSVVLHIMGQPCTYYPIKTYKVKYPMISIHLCEYKI